MYALIQMKAKACFELFGHLSSKLARRKRMMKVNRGLWGNIYGTFRPLLRI